MIISAIIPLLFILVFVYAAIKKVNVYSAFTKGASKAIPLVLKLFPFILSVLVLSEIFEKSGVSAFVTDLFSPVLGFFGIPKELAKLLIIKPFSGSGSLSLLSEIFSSYGADSYIAKCACVCFGSSETVFYISAVYFSSVKKKKLIFPIIFALISTFLSCVLSCLICRLL